MWETLLLPIHLPVVSHTAGNQPHPCAAQYYWRWFENEDHQNAANVIGVLFGRVRYWSSWGDATSARRRTLTRWVCCRLSAWWKWTPWTGTRQPGKRRRPNPNQLSLPGAPQDRKQKEPRTAAPVPTQTQINGTRWKLRWKVGVSRGEASKPGNFLQFHALYRYVDAIMIRLHFQDIIKCLVDGYICGYSYWWTLMHLFTGILNKRLGVSNIGAHFDIKSKRCQTSYRPLELFTWHYYIDFWLFTYQLWDHAYVK